MRIISWNCKMAFRNKSENILKYRPDIVIIPECENLGENNSKRIWIGDIKNKGLCIFSYSDYNLELHNSFNSEIKYAIPIKVTGKESFYILAIWAMNDKTNVKNRYISQVWNAINYYKRLLNKNIIIIGDFNWNLNFDNSLSYPLNGKFCDVLNLLSKQKIISAYHQFNNEEFGKETKPTLYLHHKIEKPYHVDYCFLSKKFQIENVETGKYDDWIKLSDHIPIIINVA